VELNGGRCRGLRLGLVECRAPNLGATVAFTMFAVMFPRMLTVLSYLESAGLFAGGGFDRAAFAQQGRACEQYHYQGQEKSFHKRCD
jgi:hypothetical protein